MLKKILLFNCLFVVALNASILTKHPEVFRDLSEEVRYFFVVTDHVPMVGKDTEIGIRRLKAIVIFAQDIKSFGGALAGLTRSKVSIDDRFLWKMECTTQ